MAGEIILREYEVRKGKGRAFIINVHPIDPFIDSSSSTLGWAKRDRPFVVQDTEDLQQQFEACGYVVKTLPAQAKQDVEKHINDIKKKALGAEFEDVDALLIVFSSYGDDGTLFCSGGNVEINELLMKSFKGDVCPHLAGKPKIFILQTCNHPQYPFSGPETSDGVDDEDKYRKDAPKKVLYKIPAEANFVFIQCLIPGTTPWREGGQMRGSMFLNHFCKHIASSPPEGFDIHQVMTRTRTDIDSEMMNKAKGTYEATWKKLPLMSSTLTKKLRFKKQ